MKKMLMICAALVIQVLCSGAVSIAAENGAVQPSTTEKYQKVRKQVEGLDGSPAGKLAPEIVEQAKKSVAAAQEGLKNGSDRITREYTELAALQAVLAGALADEREAAAAAENARKLLSAHESRLAAILSGKGDK